MPTVLFLHLFTNSQVEKILGSYIISLKENGFYKKLQKIYIFTRYATPEDLKKLTSFLEDYDKIELIEHSIEDGKYDPLISQYFDSRTSNMPVSALGEIETLLRLMLCDKCKKILQEHSRGFFIHSKNITHNSKFNERIIHNKQPTPEVVFDRMVTTYMNYIDIPINMNSFEFKTSTLLNFSVSDYLEKNKNNNFIIEKNNQLVFTNRHVFCRFSNVIRELEGIPVIDKLEWC